MLFFYYIQANPKQYVNQQFIKKIVIDKNKHKI